MTLEEFLTPFSAFTEIVIYSAKKGEHYYAGTIKDIPKRILDKIRDSDVLNVRIKCTQLHIDIWEYGFWEYNFED